MATTIKEMFDNALLSQASYANFSGIDLTNEGALSTALQEVDLGDFTVKQAEYFLLNYSVLHQFTDPVS